MYIYIYTVLLVFEYRGVILVGTEQKRWTIFAFFKKRHEFYEKEISKPREAEKTKQECAKSPSIYLYNGVPMRVQSRQLFGGQGQSWMSWSPPNPQPFPSHVLVHILASPGTVCQDGFFSRKAVHASRSHEQCTDRGDAARAPDL